MRRREFIALLGGSVAAWPLTANAQLSQRTRRIGVLMLYAEGDLAGQHRALAFQQALEKLGWTVGRNLEIDFHWGVGDAAWIHPPLLNF
jgi:putative tryptophan/tyrosine transport system substrate-binding protein